MGRVITNRIGWDDISGIDQPFDGRLPFLRFRHLRHFFRTSDEWDFFNSDHLDNVLTGCYTFGLELAIDYFCPCLLYTSDAADE